MRVSYEHVWIARLIGKDGEYTYMNTIQSKLYVVERGGEHSGELWRRLIAIGGHLEIEQ